jgi:hypothetical protein
MDSDPATRHRASLTAFAVPNLMSLSKVVKGDELTPDRLG